MKTYLLSLLALGALCFSSCNSEPTSEVETTMETVVEEPEIQVLNPVTWNYSTEKIDENKYQITFKANIQDGWYVYSSYIPEDGPIPTSIFFDENEALGSLGDMEESGEDTKDGYDEMFDMDIKKFGHSAEFSQIVKTTGPTTLTGYLEFMTCDSIQCLFPDPIEFTIDAN